MIMYTMFYMYRYSHKEEVQVRLVFLAGVFSATCSIDSFSMSTLYFYSYYKFRFSLETFYIQCYLRAEGHFRYQLLFDATIFVWFFFQTFSLFVQLDLDIDNFIVQKSDVFSIEIVPSYDVLVFFIVMTYQILALFINLTFPVLSYFRIKLGASGHSVDVPGNG